MTCQYCGDEITEENMVEEGLDICDDCYYEGEALESDYIDEYYMKKMYETDVNQYITENYNKEKEN